MADKPPQRKKRTKRRAKRGGILTQVEKTAVKALVRDQPAEMTPRQIEDLARGLRRSPQAIKALVEAAREDFAAEAQDYVRIHKDATVGALASQEHEVAGKLAQWAITNISAEGQRVIDKLSDAPQSNKILIGIRIGGVNQEAVALPSIEGAVIEE